MPSALVVLDQMPLTSNGKLDRKALPNSELQADTWRPPRTPEEEILCSIFAELLRVERVGLDDNFFAMGGHSLLAIRLVGKTRTVLHRELALSAVFSAPTPGQLSSCLRLGTGAEEVLREERRDSVPMSYGQRGVWFHDRVKGGRGTEYIMSQAQRLRGELDLSALRSALQTIVDRHEMLRTRFVERDGEPVQVIEPELRIEIPVEDLTALSEAQRQERYLEVMQREGRMPFDLERGPVLRLKLLKLGECEHVLLRTIHHIASDGWSQAVFNREFTILYEAYRNGEENPLPPLPVQYADFALWQRRWLSGVTLEKGLGYWKKQLAGIGERRELPADYARPAIPTFAGGVHQLILTEEQTSALKRASQGNQATLYMTLLATLGILLARYTGQDDVVVGSPVANRHDSKLEDLIGFFVNTMVLRMRVRPEMTFQDLLAEVRRTMLDAYRYQDVPFERLIEIVALQRSLSGSPLYQVVLTMHNTPRVATDLKGLVVENVAPTNLQVRFDLTVHAWESEGKLGFSWTYSKDLFASWRIEQMANHYVRLLDALVRNGEHPLSQLSLLTTEESQRLVLLGTASARDLRRTHRFSKRAWLKAHPEGDLAAAVQVATIHGLEVVE